MFIILLLLFLNMYQQQRDSEMNILQKPFKEKLLRGADEI